MPVTLNPFAADAFNLYSLTQGIQSLPNLYSDLMDEGIFMPEPIATQDFWVEQENGVLNLIPSAPYGAPGSEAKHAKRDAIAFQLIHLIHNDTILPAAIQGVRAFNSAELNTYAAEMTKRLAAMKKKFDITHEHLLAGAIKGQILDADSTVLVNLFTKFGISEESVDFILGTTTTDVSAKCRYVIRHIEENLKGERMTGVDCKCSPEFFDALISHPLVKEKFLNWSASAELRGDPRKSFPFGGITFREYSAKATNAAGSTVRFVGAKKARFYPVGTTDTFKLVQGPADYEETVNTPGQLYYAKQWEVEPGSGRGWKLQGQSHLLPMCCRPAVLVEGYTA